MSKHTPGPWRLEDKKLKGNRDIPTFASIIGVASTDEHIKEHPYNMMLIEAAPDLLEALEDMAELEARFGFDIVNHKHYQDTVVETVKTARAAIAKAKGEEQKSPWEVGPCPF